MKKRELETIDNYLAGSLSSEETIAFENRLREDAGFREEFEKIRLIIAGIKYSAISEQLDHVRLLNRFLEDGGILLRSGINDNGQPVIERLIKDKEWSVILICESCESCTMLMNRLANNHPDRIRVPEASPMFLKPSYIAN